MVGVMEASLIRAAHYRPNKMQKIKKDAHWERKE
jgi:hypothetical protein